MTSEGTSKDDSNSLSRVDTIVVAEFFSTVRNSMLQKYVELKLEHHKNLTVWNCAPK